MAVSRNPAEPELSTFGAGGGAATPTPRGVAELLAAYGMALLAWGATMGAAVGWVWSWRWPSPLGDWPWGPSLLAALAAMAIVVAGTVWRARALLAGDGSGLAAWAGGEALTSWAGLGGPAPALDELDGRLLSLAAEVSRSLGLPRGKVFVMRGESALNAFAVGWTPATSAIAVTRGALEVLGPEELRALLAQLYAHVKRGDARLQMAAASLVWGFAGPYNLGQQRRRADADGLPPSAVDRALGRGLVVLGWPMMVLAEWLQQRAAGDRALQADGAAARDAPSLRVPLAAVLQKAWYQHQRGTDRLQAPRLQALASMLLAIPSAGLRRAPAWPDRLRRLTGQTLEPLPCDLLTPLAVDPSIAEDLAGVEERAAASPVVATGAVPATGTRTPVEPARSTATPAAEPATAAGDLAARLSAVAASLAPTPASENAGLEADDLARVLGLAGASPVAAPAASVAHGTSNIASGTPAAAAAATPPIGAPAVPPPVVAPAPAVAAKGRWPGGALGSPGGLQGPGRADLEPATVPRRAEEAGAGRASTMPSGVPVSPIAAAWAARAGRAAPAPATVGAAPGGWAGLGAAADAGAAAGAWAPTPGRVARFGGLPPVPPPGSPEALEIERLAGLALTGVAAVPPLAGALRTPGASTGAGAGLPPFDDGSSADSGATPLDDGAPSSGGAGRGRRHRWRRPRPYADSLMPPGAVRGRAAPGSTASAEAAPVVPPTSRPAAAHVAADISPATTTGASAVPLPGEAAAVRPPSSDPLPDAAPTPSSRTAVATVDLDTSEAMPAALRLPALDMPALDRELDWGIPGAAPSPPVSAVDLDLGAVSRPADLRLTPLPEVTELGDLPDLVLGEDAPADHTAITPIPAPSVAPPAAARLQPPPGTGLDLGPDDGPRGPLASPEVDRGDATAAVRAEGSNRPGAGAPDGPAEASGDPLDVDRLSRPTAARPAGLPAGLAPPVGSGTAPRAAPTVLRDISAWLDATRTQPARGRRADEPTSAWPPLVEEEWAARDPGAVPSGPMATPRGRAGAAGDTPRDTDAKAVGRDGGGAGATPTGRVESVPARPPRDTQTAAPAPMARQEPPEAFAPTRIELRAVPPGRGPAAPGGAGDRPAATRPDSVGRSLDTSLDDARERLARLQGSAELRAAILAFMVSPGSDREVRAWRGETESSPRAAQVFADLGVMPPAARLPWFSEFVRRASLGSIEDRRSLVEAARRVMTAAGVVKPLDRLRWLALRHGLGHSQKRAVVTPVVPSPSGELAFFASNRRPIGTYTAFLARVVPLYSTDVGIDPLGARWYDAVMQRFFGAQDLGAAQVPDSDALVHALWTLQTMPWMSRPPLIRAWVGEAVVHSGERGLAREAADALYLTCMMLDSPMPPDLAKAFVEVAPPASPAGVA